MELGHARRVAAAVVAHADVAVEAAREAEVVVARLQLILDEGGVELLLVLPEEDAAKAEHLLGFAHLDDRWLAVDVPREHRPVLARHGERRAALCEPAEPLLVERAHRLADVP